MATIPKTSKKSTEPKSMTEAAKNVLADADVPADAAIAPVVVSAATPVVAGPKMRKPELIDAIVAKTGMKKKDVKPIVEATLAVLGSALYHGRELNLEPLGKVLVNREKKMASGKVLKVKIRQPNDLPNEPINPDPKDLDQDAVVPTTAE